MVLGFKEFFDAKKTKPTYFREKILAFSSLFRYGAIAAAASRNIHIPKIHTIREGHRFKAGDLLHMAYGVRTKNYRQFNKGIPELERCVSVQDITIWYTSDGAIDISIDRELILVVRKSNDGMYFCGWNKQNEWLKSLATNDGFDSVEDFFAWFSKNFEGQIIHWTDLKY